MLLKLGDRASLNKTITPDDVSTFAFLTQDTNPLHLDEEYARQTRFGGCIVHGMLGASLISAVIGTKLGGPIYLSQTLKFLKPIRIGETITAIAEVIAVRDDNHIVTLETYVTNGEGQKAIVGEAVVLPLES
jgi:3-hydroxybutyryl-CoA dehydratase